MKCLHNEENVNISMTSGQMKKSSGIGKTMAENAVACDIHAYLSLRIAQELIKGRNINGSHAKEKAVLFSQNMEQHTSLITLI